MEEYLGKHILLELKECDSIVLNDIETIESIMLSAAKTAKLTIVEKCFHKFSPYGVSGVVVIAESHLSIHTWPPSIIMQQLIFLLVIEIVILNMQLNI